jgi:hypothetical protein
MRYELMLSFTKRDTCFQLRVPPCGGRLVFTLVSAAAGGLRGTYLLQVLIAVIAALQRDGMRRTVSEV